jgi:hypothetical protein
MSSKQSNQTQKENIIYTNPKTDFGFKRLFMEGLKVNRRNNSTIQSFARTQIYFHRRFCNVLKIIGLQHYTKAFVYTVK